MSDSSKPQVTIVADGTEVCITTPASETGVWPPGPLENGGNAPSESLTGSTMAGNFQGASRRRGARLLGIYPKQTMTGTITLYNENSAATSGSTMVFAAGLTQNGINFGPKGIVFNIGIGVKHGAAEACHYVWEPLY